jgi:protein tyrosine phosphatase (PTP) superfamily phosphohydrolase (DUF442 family)
MIHWAIPGVLAHGERPGFPLRAVPSDVVEDWLKEVKRQGIRSVINLLVEDEMAVYYRRLGLPLLDYYAEAGLRVREVAHDDGGMPVSNRILLDRVRVAFENLPKPVLIHCSAGAERSQQAVALLCMEWKARTKKRCKEA